MVSLDDVNPCGYEERPSSQCKYVPQCFELGRTSGEFICISKMAHQVAGYLVGGSDVETEKKDLRDFIRPSFDKKIVDPEGEWNPQLLRNLDTDEVISKIMQRGTEYSERVKSNPSKPKKKRRSSRF